MELLLLPSFHHPPWPSTLKLHLLLACLSILLLLPLAHSATPSTTSPGSLVDRQALLSFKSLLSGNDSLSSWNDTIELCQWVGITCDKLHLDRVSSLDLPSSNLTGRITPSLANLTFLSIVNLRDNHLHGVLPPELGSMRSLTELYVDSNELEGEIPGTMGHLSNLVALWMDDNQLQGNIPASLGNCTKLSALLLRNNYLTGTIPPPLANISALTGIDLGFNNLTGEIPAGFGSIQGLQLLFLGFNNLSGMIPPNIYNMSSLYVLALGSNQLVGSLPIDFGRYLPSLAYLYMYEIHLEGPIPSSIVNASNLVDVEFSKNRLTGLVPPNLDLLPNLQKLNLDNNLLESKTEGGWDFLTSLGNCRQFSELDLSYNNFSGPLPDSLGSLSTTLSWLRLRGNQITGKIPRTIGNLKGLNTLDIEYNQLTGSIPDTVGNLENLNALSFRGNMLSGEIPSSLGRLTNLSELYLSKNNLSGSIPSSFASLQMLQVFDIAYNNLSGTIPRGVISISSLTSFLNLSHNNFEGGLPVEVGKLINLKALDISRNKLSGNIPSSLGDCTLLEYLNMEGNSFNGTIPESLKVLGVQILDLSQNQLSGPIPTFLQTMRSLQFLNLSFNNFEGEVPTGGIFNNSNSFSVAGNEDLCGGQPGLNLRSCSKKSGLSTKAKAIIIAVAVLGFLFLLLLMVILSCKCQGIKHSKVPNHDSDSWESQFAKVSYSDLKNATNGFSPSNLIGTGGFGSVYKGYLEQEKRTVAVKVLDHRLHAASKSFMAECTALKNIRHRNLVSILTSCSTVDAIGNDFRALVYPFVSNGSLHMWLHRDAPSNTAVSIKMFSLNVNQRLNIAIDIASALDYLHNLAETPIVHRDLKPSNVLLDDDFTAHVGDFGIAKFLPSNMELESTFTGIKGSIGYMPPESGMGGPVSTLWDVYSFGVMLLEIFTGKKPTDESFIEGFNLHKYVERSFPEYIQDIVDPEMLLDEKDGNMSHRTRECLISVIGIALICSNESPRERMNIHEVLNQLNDLKKVFQEL